MRNPKQSPVKHQHLEKTAEKETKIGIEAEAARKTGFLETKERTVCKRIRTGDLKATEN